MDVLSNIILNKIILSCLISIIIAQILKVVVSSIKKKRLDFSMLLLTGNMPSGHSAVMGALVTAAYLIEGVSSLFALSCVLAVMVIYDSLTIRKAVGHHTTILNEILKALKLHHKYSVKELAGHSFIQIIVGLLLGIAVALIVNRII
ncbi:MAG: divergent PAP2 family protein [Candidatus Woesearchaeota archaeon]|nr:divergent PAP2 family protein [Candidatus Woesearchaeota archaeon]